MFTQDYCLYKDACMLVKTGWCGDVKRFRMETGFPRILPDFSSRKDALHVTPILCKSTWVILCCLTRNPKKLTQTLSDFGKNLSKTVFFLNISDIFIIIQNSANKMCFIFKCFKFRNLQSLMLLKYKIRDFFNSSYL